jgi:hypothetical protein
LKQLIEVPPGGTVWWGFSQVGTQRNILAWPRLYHKPLAFVQLDSPQIQDFSLVEPSGMMD